MAVALLIPQRGDAQFSKADDNKGGGGIKKMGSDSPKGFGNRDEAKKTETRDAPRTVEEPPSVIRRPIDDRLDSLVIKHVAFEETPLKSAVDYLVGEARAADPDRKGVVILLTGDREALAQIKVTLDLREIPMSEVLRYLTMVTGVQCRVDPDSISISPPAAGASDRDKSALPPLQRSIASLLERKSVLKALNSTRIKSVEFQDTPSASAFNYLVEQGRKMESGGGVSVVPVGDPETFINSKVTLNLRDLSLLQALRYTAQAANLRFRVEPHAVLIVPSDAETPGHRHPSLERDVDLVSAQGTAAARKASELVLGQVVFDETPIRNVVDHLTAEARRVDPRKEGVNLVLAIPAEQLTKTVTLNLSNVTLAQALKFVAQVSDLEIRAENEAIVVMIPSTRAVGQTTDAR